MCIRDRSGRADLPAGIRVGQGWRFGDVYKRQGLDSLLLALTRANFDLRKNIGSMHSPVSIVFFPFVKSRLDFRSRIWESVSGSISALFPTRMRRYLERGEFACTAFTIKGLDQVVQDRYPDVLVLYLKRPSKQREFAYALTGRF